MCIEIIYINVIFSIFEKEEMCCQNHDFAKFYVVYGPYLYMFDTEQWAHAAYFVWNFVGEGVHLF